MATGAGDFHTTLHTIGRAITSRLALDITISQCMNAVLVADINDLHIPTTKTQLLSLYYPGFMSFHRFRRLSPKSSSLRYCCCLKKLARGWSSWVE